METPSNIQSKHIYKVKSKLNMETIIFCQSIDCFLNPFFPTMTYKTEDMWESLVIHHDIFVSVSKAVSLWKRQTVMLLMTRWGLTSLVQFFD